MKHRIRKVLLDDHPYEHVEIELVAEDAIEKVQITQMSEFVQNYLAIDLSAVDVIESNPPFFIIKKVKKKIGFGG
jgi:hypothetical protein